MTYIPQGGIASTANSTTTPLSGGATFTGTAELNAYSDVLVTCKTDVAGTLYVDLSIDGTNWDTQIPFVVDAATGEFHSLVKGPRYCRIRFVNGSSAQGYFRLKTYYGTFRQPNSALSTPIQQDADASTVRAITEEVGIAAGMFTGYSIINKFGRNPDLDSGTEDLWNGGGTYTGFPTGSPENLMVVSASASDTGTITFQYLATSSSTAYQTGTATLNGLTPVNTGVSVYRVHSATYSSGSATTFNVGEISGYHQTTTANIFFKMPVGRSQTNVCAYTIPAGSTGYLRRLFGQVRGTGTAVADFDLWVRVLNGSPRLRHPKQAVQGDRFDVRPYGGLVLLEGTDVKYQLTTSTNNLDVIGGFDIVLVKN